jgi:hypothetical protein
MAHQRITFVPNGLTKSDLMAASKAAFRRFYLRPKIVKETLLGLTSARAIKGAFMAFVVFLGTILRKSDQ